MEKIIKTLDDRKPTIILLSQHVKPLVDLGIYTWKEDEKMVRARDLLSKAKDKLELIPDKRFGGIRFLLDMYTDIKDEIRDRGAEIVTNAWYKIHEIIHLFRGKLIGKPQGEKSFEYFDACALPGAFSAAIHHNLISLGYPLENLKWQAESLWIPGEDKKALGDHYGLVARRPDNFDFGPTGNGDITQEENIYYWRNKYYGRDLFVSDCGIDVSSNFNLQELANSKVHTAQIILGLSLLRKGGSAVWKTYTTFEPVSISVLYYLATKFQELYLVKPLTSRPGNSEIYLVGIGMKGITEEEITKLIDFLNDIDLENTETTQKALIPFEKIPRKWIKMHRNMVTNLVESQIRALELFNKLYNLPYYRDDHKKQLIQLKKKKTLEWLRDYPVEILPEKYKLMAK